MTRHSFSQAAGPLQGIGKSDEGNTTPVVEAGEKAGEKAEEDCRDGGGNDPSRKEQGGNITRGQSPPKSDEHAGVGVEGQDKAGSE